MNSPDPNALNELVEGITALIASEPVDKSQTDWHNRYQAICDRIKKDPLLSGLEVEEHVWHWLSDADIRARDIDYARLQNEGIVRILNGWKAGN